MADILKFKLEEIDEKFNEIIQFSNFEVVKAIKSHKNNGMFDSLGESVETIDSIVVRYIVDKDDVKIELHK